MVPEKSQSNSWMRTGGEPHFRKSSYDGGFYWIRLHIDDIYLNKLQEPGCDLTGIER